MERHPTSVSIDNTRRLSSYFSDVSTLFTDSHTHHHHQQTFNPFQRSRISASFAFICRACRGCWETRLGNNKKEKQSHLSNKKAKKIYLNKIFQVKERQRFTKRLTILPAPEALQVFHQQQQDLFQNPKTNFNDISNWRRIQTWYLTWWNFALSHSMFIEQETIFWAPFSLLHGKFIRLWEPPIFLWDSKMAEPCEHTRKSPSPPPPTKRCNMWKEASRLHTGSQPTVARQSTDS